MGTINHLPALRPLRGQAQTFFRDQVAVVTDDCQVWPYTRIGTGYGVNRGYGVVRIDGKNRLVHRYACELRWGPSPLPKMDAAHGPCHNSLCFNASHLSWKTRADNLSDMLRDGTLLRGVSQPSSKLTDDQVIAIRALYGAGGRGTKAALARKYGVSPKQIDRIASGENWRHLLKSA